MRLVEGLRRGRLSGEMWRKERNEGEKGVREEERTTGEEKDRIRQLNDGEVAQVLQVDDMAAYAKQGQPHREAVDDQEQELQDDNAVDEAGEKLLGEDGMFFNELGEVVESRCWKEADC